MATLRITASSGNQVTLTVDHGQMGAQGLPGEGVPVGGLAGQVLAKATNANYDTTWISMSGLIFRGTWNAATNTPTLASGVGTNGDYYIVNVPGNTDLDGITDWKVNDWAIFNGTTWEKIDNTDTVTSVNSMTGAVTLAAADVGAPTTAGVGATGTWGINISGNAATATNATNATNANNATNATNATNAGTADLAAVATEATNIAGGVAGSIPFQTAIDATTFLPIGSVGQVLTVVAGAPAWQNGGAGSLTGRTDAATPFLTALGTGAGAVTTGTNNTTVGYNAGVVLAAGSQNVLVGAIAGDAMTTGGTNVAVGYNAMGTTTGSSNNTVIGASAMSGANNTGGNNTIIGASAGNLLTGGYNVMIGGSVGTSASTVANSVLIGWNNGEGLTTAANGTVAVGYLALNSLSTGAGNTALGLNAGAGISTTNYGTYLGWNAGAVVTGQSNIFIGASCGDQATSITGAVVIGVDALGGVATNSAIGTVAVGNNALLALTAGANNTAVGHQVGQSLLTGGQNTLMGYQAGLALTGSANTFIGSNTGDAATTLTNAVAVGQGALGAAATVAATGAVAVGKDALAVLTTGAANTAIGYQAGSAQTIGSNNVYLGYQAGSSATSGAGNTVVGTQASKLSNGSLNTVIGYLAGTAMTTAGNNTLVGYQAGVALTSGGGNILIGDDAGANLTTGTNNVIIGSINAPSAGVNGWVMIGDSSGDLAIAFNDAGAMSFDGTTFGTAGQTLRSNGDGAAPTWGAANTQTVVNAVANYTVLATDAMIFANANAGGFSVTLPNAATYPGATYTVKRIDNNDTNILTVNSAGGLVEGAASVGVPINYGYQFVSNGANWYITLDYAAPALLASPQLLSAMGGDTVATVTFDPVPGATTYTAEVTPL